MSEGWLRCRIRTVLRLSVTESSVSSLLPTFATLMLVAASGCAVHRVRADYTGFEKAYADTSNRELLLNLARLQNHDPTYFFKMGQITSSYRMAATVSSNVSYLSQSTVAGKSNTGGGGVPALSYESDPLFQFIPVNDETNAQLLLKPIPSETFYILYQQGWRIDQLLRLMVDRIEVTNNSAASGCTVTTYRNVPPPVKIDGSSLTVLDPDQLSRYVSFLRVSAIAYGLQKHGDLLLRGVSTFVPLDINSQSVATVMAGDAKKSSGTASEVHGAAGIDAQDVEKAAEKNFSYELVNGKILIGQRIVNAKFYLLPPKSHTSKYAPDLEKIQGVLDQDPELKGLEKGQALQGFLSALQNGFTIEGDSTKPNQTGEPCPTGDESTSVHLVLRSLIGVMAAAAQEQALFDELKQHDSLIEGKEGLRFLEAVPEIEQVPVLRINWRPVPGVEPAQPLSGLQLTAALVELNYRGTDYLIADLQDPLLQENEYWNRDVFRLVGALTAQVTVDISKYPIANILQLNSITQ
jgi:hypothetical protein